MFSSLLTVVETLAVFPILQTKPTEFRNQRFYLRIFHTLVFRLRLNWIFSIIYTVKTASVNLHEKAGIFTCGPHVCQLHVRFTCGP